MVHADDDTPFNLLLLTFYLIQICRNNLFCQYFFGLERYGGLNGFDPYENAEFTAHLNEMHFEKKHGNNHNMILGIKDGFDLDYKENHESNVDLWGPWHLSYDFFEQVTLYYKDLANVLCYSKELGVCECDEV
jgi:hypothetical protein